MSDIGKLLLFSLLFLFCRPAYSQWADRSPGVFITEEDGSPDSICQQLKMSNGDVTDNGDGTCSILTAGSISDPRYDQILDPTANSLIDFTTFTNTWTSTGGNPVFYDGNVGVGTTAPETALHVDGAVTVGVGTTVDSNIIIKYNGTETLRITADTDANTTKITDGSETFLTIDNLDDTAAYTNTWTAGAGSNFFFLDQTTSSCADNRQIYFNTTDDVYCRCTGTGTSSVIGNAATPCS